MRATMELYGDAMEYPAIHAQVALGNEDLTVKVGPSPPEGPSVFARLLTPCPSAGERSGGRRAAAQDRALVHLHVLHGAAAQPGRLPRRSSGQWSRSAAPR